MKIKDEELITDLKRVREIIGKIPTQNKYSKLGRYSTTTFTNRKPWRVWLSEVFEEVKYKPRGSKKRISKEDLIENLKDLYSEIGRVPRKEDLKLGKYGVSGYNRVFGGFSNALIEVGWEANLQSYTHITKDDCISEILKIYKMLNKVPRINDYIEYASIPWAVVHNLFGTWNSALLESGLQVNYYSIVSKTEVIDALHKWFEKNNNDVRCLEYWKIRKAKARKEFPFASETISSKFNNIAWENIMKECGFTDYQTIDQFCSRQNFLGEDGNSYLSSIEKQAADILFELKNNGNISNYIYEEKVCNDKSWTCDFKIVLENDKCLWLEIDGMGSSRKHPYSKVNEKIEYYIDNNFNYKIISYNHKNVKNSIEKFINEN